MAAITYKFGVESDVSTLDTASAEMPVPRGGGLGEIYDGSELGEDFEGDLTASVINGTHAGLQNMAWLRRVVEEVLEGRGFHVEFVGREVKLVLDQALPSVPAWNPPTQAGLKNFSLLSWTSKMGTPSFSLPAGATVMGGTCPGANAGQTIVPVATLKKAAREVKSLIGRSVHLAQAICQHCLAGDTRVLVRDRGLVRLDELGDGEFDVWSGLQWRHTKLVQQGVREVVLLRTTWGHEITLTPDHKVLTDDGMVEVQDLDLGAVLRAQLPLTGGSTGFPESAALPALDLGPQHGNALATSYPTHWSRDVGYTLGAILGDGCIHYREHPTVTISSTVTDREVLDHVSAAIRSWCATESDVTVGPVMAQAFWRVKSLVQFFDALGLDKRPESSARRAPASLWTASREGVVGFLQGLFDTDGSVSVGASKVEVSLASVSEGLLRDVQQLLGAFGVRSNICPYKTSNRVREAEGHHALYKLSIGGIDSLRAFMSSVGFRLTRKRTRLADAVLAADRVGRETQPRVASITKLRAHVPVFDLLNVGDEHQFLANGISVSNCYAEGGQYSTGQVQFAQVLRFAWVQQAVGDGTFAQVMDWAIKNANFHLDGKGYETIETERDGVLVKEKVHVTGERDGQKYFRLHDSGDFFSPEYIAAWKQVADLNPDVQIWAPSRAWAVRGLRDAVNLINAEPRNFVVRPSAYHVNESPPRDLGPGWAAGSCAFADMKKPSQESRLSYEEPYQWDCQAYQTDNDKVTCRDARAPGDDPNGSAKGCRACWKYGNPDEQGNPGLIVNYTLH